MFLRSSHALLLFAAAVFAQQPPAPAVSASATLSGRTVDGEGKPVRKTVVTLRPSAVKSGEMPVPYSTTSDADGKFSFDGVEPGSYTLMADHAGYLRQVYGPKRSSMMPTVLKLTAGQKMTELTFALTPQAVVSGKVVDDDGDPVGRTQVRLMRSMYANGKRQLVPAGMASSDESGEFKITNVAAGRYFLSAVPQRNNMFESTRRAGAANDPAKPEEDFVTTYYPGVTDSASCAAVEVASGQNLAGMDIRLRKLPVFRIKGKLTGGNPDEPLQRLRVTLMQRDSQFMGFGGPSAAVAKDGAFELTGVAPGSYTLAAMNANGMMKIVARQPVEIANRSVDNIVLPVQPASTLQGAVKLEKQAAGSSTQTAPDLSSIRVSLTATDGPSFNMPSGAVKSDGTFSLADVPSGTYKTNAFNLPDGTYLKAIRYEREDVLGSELRLTSGGGTLEIIISGAAGEVDGSIQTEKRETAGGTLVTLVPDPVVPDQTYRNRSAIADQNGQFALKSVAPGKYRVYAWEDVENGAPFDPDFVKPLENLGTKITVDENGRQQVSVPAITVAQIEQAKQK